MSKIYYSIPVSNKSRDTLFKGLKEQIERVTANNTSTPVVNYWVQNTAYNSIFLADCNIFVFIPENNDFKFDICTLPSGVAKEFKRAYAMNKSIYMLYKPMLEPSPKYYRVQFDSNTGFISGLPGSSGEFWTELREDKEKVNSLTWYQEHIKKVKQGNAFTIDIENIPKLEDMADLIKSMNQAPIQFSDKELEPFSYDRRLLID